MEGSREVWILNDKGERLTPEEYCAIEVCEAHEHRYTNKVVGWNPLPWVEWLESVGCPPTVAYVARALERLVPEVWAIPSIVAVHLTDDLDTPHGPCVLLADKEPIDARRALLVYVGKGA